MAVAEAIKSGKFTNEELSGRISTAMASFLATKYGRDLTGLNTIEKVIKSTNEFDDDPYALLLLILAINTHLFSQKSEGECPELLELPRIFNTP